MANKRSVAGPGLEALLAPKPSVHFSGDKRDSAPPAVKPAATIQLNVRVPEDLRDAIDCGARAVGLKQAAFVVQALRGYLEGRGLDAKHRTIAATLRGAPGR